ncbi:MAG: sulfate ABC transporter permease subunit CysT [Acidobacteria bacterium]|nr:sulfate ABC transporter permease subunit CysT [Acidobacteriota bacterium]MCW5969869.1 sulfate ABC transporter permease subunit CysT [Blastocatellales bacterium]
MTATRAQIERGLRVGRVHPWGRWGLRGAAIVYIGAIVLLPIAALVEHGLRDGIEVFWREATAPVALAALRLTLGTAAVVTAVNIVLGTLTAWVLVRYRFAGRAWLDALVDLPFAIPTLVTGVCLVALYGPHRALGAWLEARGVSVLFARPGIVLALLFVTYPFVVRSVQPVLMEIDGVQEEASWTLGASKLRTFFRITLPAIAPGISTGALLGFARALGEFGSIVVVAGNLPYRTLTAPVYIFGQIESQETRSASAVSVVLLAISFVLMLAVDWRREREESKYAAG